MKYLLLSFWLLSINPTFAQNNSSKARTDQLNAYEDSLKALTFQVINNQNELERYNNNYRLVKTLVKTLKVPGSFSYPFDSLKALSILTSPDNKFKVFSWHVMNNDGSYRYYGTIQMNTAREGLQLFPLIDFTASLQNPEDSITSHNKWYGAQYYQIIPVTQNVPLPYYILLGWKGNTIKTTKKVIEVLYFKDGTAYFGLPVFEGNKDRFGQKRVIFEYSRQVSMLLKYLPSEKQIVFDHLAAPDARMKDKFDFYGPDMSYDGYKLNKGKWRMVEDLELKNESSVMDEQYNDPKNPRSKPLRKFIEE